MKIAPILRRAGVATWARCTSLGCPHRTALRLRDVGECSSSSSGSARPTSPRSRSGPGTTAPQTGRIMAGVRGPTTRGASPSRRAAWSSSATSTRPWPAPLVAAQFGVPDGARRGWPALVQSDDARGDQSPGHRCARRPAAGTRAGGAWSTSSARARRPRARRVRRQLGHRHPRPRAPGGPGPSTCRIAQLGPLALSKAVMTLVTLHRPSNVDNPVRRSPRRWSGFSRRLAARQMEPVVIPAHPRTRKQPSRRRASSPRWGRVRSDARRAARLSRVPRSHGRRRRPGRQRLRRRSGGDHVPGHPLHHASQATPSAP